MSFYVCLPSNACSQQFPSNTQSNYNTILQKPICLDSDNYEVAITEIIYSPNYLANFGYLEYNDQKVELRIRNEIEKNQIVAALNKAIQNHCLKKMTSQIFEQNLLNKNIPSFTDNFILKYNGQIKFVGSFSMILSKKDETVLKNGESLQINEDRLNVANYAAIYTNIVDEQYFGDSLVPILRCVNLTTNSKLDSVTNTFENLVYVPVNKRIISTINIKITDLEGQLIQFNNIFSFVIVTLHFRKKYYA